MAKGFDDYVRGQLGGFKEGAGGLARSAVADIGNSYQQVLMANASIRAPRPFIAAGGPDAPHDLEGDASASSPDAAELEAGPPEIDVE
jgi:hypothetical protein